MTARIDSATLVIDVFENGVRRVIRIDVPYPLRPDFEREVRIEWDAHSAKVTAAAKATDPAGRWFL